MMKTYRSCLCVGGPLGGIRRESENRTGFIIAQQAAELVRPDDPEFRPNARVEIFHTQYKAEIFATPQGDVVFWVPNGQTPLETLTILMEAYERKRTHD